MVENGMELKVWQNRNHFCPFFFFVDHKELDDAAIESTEMIASELLDFIERRKRNKTQSDAHRQFTKEPGQIVIMSLKVMKMRMTRGDECVSLWGANKRCMKARQKNHDE